MSNTSSRLVWSEDIFLFYFFLCVRISHIYPAECQHVGGRCLAPDEEWWQCWKCGVSVRVDVQLAMLEEPRGSFQNTCLPFKKTEVCNLPSPFLLRLDTLIIKKTRVEIVKCLRWQVLCCTQVKVAVWETQLRHLYRAVQMVYLQVLDF